MSRDALVVGINKYDKLRHLKSPAYDAEAVADVLEKYGEFDVVRRLPGVKDSENAVVRVGQKTRVTQSQFEDEIVKLFKPDGKNIPDVALLYFSGHGLRKDKGIKEGFLASSDIGFGIRLKWLRELLQESPIKQQIIWLDCCHSGELLNFNEVDPGDSGKASARCFIAASREFEESFEAIDSRHSIFTEALLKGLNPLHIEGEWIDNYSLITTLKKELRLRIQQPVFTNSGGSINLTISRCKPVEVEIQGKEDNICPYKGLSYFDIEDAKYFYGRTRLTDQLLIKVKQSNFLAILGASGSGKSSVMRAGLLHQLQVGQRISGSDRWDVYIMKPGDHPMQSLAQAFLDSNKSQEERAIQRRFLEKIVEDGSEGLRRWLQESDSERIILAVDQFEEVFSLCRDKVERQKFFECLLGVLPKTNSKFCLIITMRGDFFGKCLEQEYGGLAKQIQHNLVTVQAMDQDELRQAIILPAKLVNLEVELELVNQMLFDVGDSPGYLPLLQYALTELWEQRIGNCLDLRTYASLNGVMGALQRRATEVCKSFADNTERDAVQHIFVALTQLGEGTEDTRRRVFKQDLLTKKFTTELIDRVLKKLADANLVVTSAVNGNADESMLGDAVVDVAHEVLIRHWDLLRNWLGEDRDNLKKLREIEDAADRWRRKGKTSDLLLQGKQLKEAKQLQKIALDTISLSTLAIDFIDQSNKRGLIGLFKVLILPFLGTVFLLCLVTFFIALDIVSNYSERKNSIGLRIALGTLVVLQQPLNGVDLGGANLSSAHLSYVNLSSANLSSADLSSADLSSANLRDANLSSADLIDANLRYANLSSANLSSANLSSADLIDANLRYANLSSANLSSANLSSADLIAANLRSANLSYANLSSADLSSAYLRAAHLIAANLSSADLSYADLIDADLIDAHLRSADLRSANLSYANLSSAHLRSAYLSSAHLRSAYLRAADLRAANLSYAHLRSADLENVKWNEHTTLKDLKGLETAKNVPPEFMALWRVQNLSNNAE